MTDRANLVTSLRESWAAIDAEATAAAMRGERPEQASAYWDALAAETRARDALRTYDKETARRVVERRFSLAGEHLAHVSAALQDDPPAGNLIDDPALVAALAELEAARKALAEVTAPTHSELAND